MIVPYHKSHALQWYNRHPLDRKCERSIVNKKVELKPLNEAPMQMYDLLTEPVCNIGVGDTASVRIKLEGWRA